MATFYLDYEAGNDANDGTTFANRWKTITNGATAARIAPGDTIRVMASPSPTSLGSAAWTSGPQPATKTITGATNATPISITCTSHGYSTGDTVYITSATGNTAANGYWEITVTGVNTFTLDGSVGNGTFSGSATVALRNSFRVLLNTEVTKTVASTGGGRSAWTASANVTTALNTSQFKEHNYSDEVVVTTTFNTGKAAYYTLPSAVNLSAYQQISFWIYPSISSITSGQLELRLCSDTTGDTVVNTITIPTLASSNRWHAVVVNNGSALGSSIASVSLYANSDVSVSSNTTLYINNIFASTGTSSNDSLTLYSLIGKNTSTETWWGIQSVNGRRVVLDSSTETRPTDGTRFSYYGTTESVTTYKREPIVFIGGSSSATAANTINDSGTDGNLITFSGGWNRTDMSTQTGETWISSTNSQGIPFVTTNRSFVKVENFGVSRFYYGLYLDSPACFFDLVAANNCQQFVGTAALSGSIEITIGSSVASRNYFAFMGNTSDVVVNLKYLIASSANGIVGQPGNLVVNGITPYAKIANSAAYAISSTNLTINSVAIADNASGGVEGGGTYIGKNIYLKNCSLLDTSEVFFLAGRFLTHYVYSHNHDNVEGSHVIFGEGGRISSATDQRHTASGISWKLQPTSTNRSSVFPLYVNLSKIACASGKLVTVKAWMRRDNTGLTMRLVCKGGQISGVSNDVIASMTAVANTWEELTITFTPTEVGVVEIRAEAWGGTTYSGWVDDMTVTQAV